MKQASHEGRQQPRVTLTSKPKPPSSWSLVKSNPRVMAALFGKKLPEGDVSGKELLSVQMGAMKGNGANISGTRTGAEDKVAHYLNRITERLGYAELLKQAFDRIEQRMLLLDLCTRT